MLCGTSAALAVLAADRQRRATGQGQLVRIALSDVAMATAGHLGYLAEAQVTGRERDRHGNAVYGSFGRDFPTRDGRRVMIVAVTCRQWHSILTATGLAEAVSGIEAEHGIDCRREADRWAAREPLFRLIEAWTSTRDYADIKRLLDQHDVLWGPYQSFAQLLEEDPRCSLANPMFAEIDQPGFGRHLAPGCAIEFGGGERVPVRPAPRLGAHTEAVLGGLLHLGKAEQDRLRAAGVIATGAGPQGD
jgi:2-methylfumaryl-CoA isomerase